MASPIVNFSGIASGIDSSSLIKALIDSERSARITPLQDRITTLTDTDDSLTKLKDLLTTLKDKAQVLRSLNGGAVGKLATSSNESVVSGTASNSAASGSYSVTVSQLARSATYSFNDRFASDTTIINSSINNGASAAQRTVSISVGTGSSQEDISVELTNTSTLSDFVTSFNSQSSQAEAAVVNVGTSASPSYAVVISSNNQGTERGTLNVSVGSEITGAGSGALIAATTSQALDAEFTLSGISGTLTRSSNDVSDVVQGLTLNLQSIGSATISIGTDKSTSSDNIQSLVDAYNDVINYVAKNDKITREQDGTNVTNVFGTLSSTQVDESLISSLRSSLSGASTSGGLVNTLADLGITTNRDGTLAFDQDVFQTALSTDGSNSQAILEALGESFGAVDGTIAQFTQFNGIIDGETRSNEQQISSLNTRISSIESFISKEQDSLTSRFARLESLIGKLNSQQSALSGLLPG